MLRAARVLLAGAIASSLLAACVDLFHSTSFENACGADAGACAAAEAAVPPGSTGLCAQDHPSAVARATHACAWLGACASPIGDNAFGACMVRALLAYDCAANPDRQLRPGGTYEFWDQLARATSCGDVLGAISPHTQTNCAAASSAYTGCSPGGATLVACNADDAGSVSAPGIESCEALGQTCASAGGIAACAGASGACAGDNAGCAGTQLEDCSADAGVFDLGIDCASVGAGQCVSASGIAACAATGALCTPSATITCSAAGVATGCPSGFAESVACNALLGAGGASCNAGAVGRPWDVSRACAASAPCPPDSCGGPGGTLLASCARGASFHVDCAGVGNGTCRVDPTTQHAACVPAVAIDP